MQTSHEAVTAFPALGGPAAESTAARAGTLPACSFQEEAEPRIQIPLSEGTVHVRDAKGEQSKCCGRDSGG